MKTRTMKVLQTFLVLAAVLLAFFLMVSKTSVTAPAHAQAGGVSSGGDDRFFFRFRSADAGAFTATLCPGNGQVNLTLDVMCNAAWCYKTAGLPGTTNSTVTPVFPSCYNGDYVYDGGTSTTIFNEGLFPGPVARIQTGNHACIAFGSKDNALDAGTPNCSVWIVNTNNGQVSP